MKDKLGGKILTKFVGLKAKTDIYKINDGSKDKRAKSGNKCVRRKAVNLRIIKLFGSNSVS